MENGGIGTRNLRREIFGAERAKMLALLILTLDAARFQLLAIFAREMKANFKLAL